MKGAAVELDHRAGQVHTGEGAAGETHLADFLHALGQGETGEVDAVEEYETAQLLHALRQGDAAHLAVAEAAAADFAVRVGNAHTGEQRLVESSRADARDAGVEIHCFERGITVESVVADFGNLIGYGD